MTAFLQIKFQGPLSDKDFLHPADGVVCHFYQVNAMIKI